jgi:hypothetical protein
LETALEVIAAIIKKKRYFELNSRWFDTSLSTQLQNRGLCCRRRSSFYTSPAIAWKFSFAVLQVAENNMFTRALHLKLKVAGLEWSN